MLDQLFLLRNYNFTFYCLPPFLVGLMVFVVGIAVFLRERGTRVSLAFFLVTMSTTIWLLSTVALYAAPNDIAALWWAKLEHVGVIFIPPFIYMLAFAMVHQYSRTRASLLASIIISGFFVVGMLSTNSFISGLYKYPLGYYGKYGVLGELFLIYFFVIATSVITRFFKASQRISSPESRPRFRAFLIACCIGYIASADFLPNHGIYIYPFGCFAITIFILITARTIWCYHLIDITPEFAAQEIIVTIGDPLFVLDDQGIIKVTNPAASELFGRPIHDLIDKDISEVIDDPLFSSQLSEMVYSKKINNHIIPYALDQGANKRFLSLSTSIMSAKSARPIAIICVFRDVTDLKQAQEEIETLQGFIPICARCKSIRNDKGYWEKLEKYITDRPQAEFTHGICPKCAKEMYGYDFSDGDSDVNKSKE